MTTEEKICIVSSGQFSSAVSVTDLVTAQATPSTLKEHLGHCLIWSARALEAFSTAISFSDHHVSYISRTQEAVEITHMYSWILHN